MLSTFIFALSSFDFATQNFNSVFTEELIKSCFVKLQMDEKFTMTAKDLAKDLRVALKKIMS